MGKPGEMDIWGSVDVERESDKFNFRSGAR
jgi:hypothetical protein